MNFIDEEKKDLKNLFSRFKKRDFSGDAGQAIKNSSYQLTQNIVMKIGSLIFMVLLARLLLPEKLGIYNLALATILLFSSFSDLGISSSLLTYVSRFVSKGKEEISNSYFRKLLNWKLWLVSITSLILIASSQLVSTYYNKPIFYALISGAIYLPIVSMIGFIESLLKSTGNFKTSLRKEIIFQISRFALVPLVIVPILKTSASDQAIVLLTIVTVTVSHAICLIFLIINAKKNIFFLKSKSSKLSSNKIIDLKRFIYPLSATALAGLFFGYVDTLMLGRFVSSEYIAYYGVSFGLIGGVTAIISFMSIVMMPIFAKKSGKALESVFRETRKITFLISVVSAIFTYLISYWAIKIIYGAEYLASVNILKAFAIMIVILPLSGIYVSYFTTQKKTKELAGLAIFGAVLNVVLNIFAINMGVKIGGGLGGVYGAVIATIISRLFYLGGLIFYRKFTVTKEQGNK